MLTKIQCLRCDTRWDYQDQCDGEDYICPECGTDETEELCECRCTICGYHCEINPFDPCPECGEWELEEID